MDYLVIELKPVPRIKTLDGEPIIYKAKNDAFRAADKCVQGLVYPILNIMKIFEEIRVLCKTNIPESKDDQRLLDELLALTDEII